MQPLEEQISTIERALGERMIHHALVIVRSWVLELGSISEYDEKKSQEIEKKYTQLFDDWLVGNQTPGEDDLDSLTRETYNLVDTVYAQLRLFRGLSPHMHGFNGDNPQSVVHYFASCLELSLTDYEWLSNALKDPERATIALMAVAALTQNLRTVFSEIGMLTLIEGIQSPNEVVAEQCLANAMLLLIHYDVRIDFYPEITEAFTYAIGDGQRAFEILCALIKATDSSSLDMYATGEATMEDLPDEMQKLLKAMHIENDSNAILTLLPAAGRNYMKNIIDIFPDTWLCSSLVGDDENRQHLLKQVYLSVGRMDLVWDDLDLAEHFLRAFLRKYKTHKEAFLNYGHCLLIKGDRIMAFEAYKQARNMCSGAREFYELFRPDRKHLVDNGVPLEEVYLLEDQLFRS